MNILYIVPYVPNLIRVRPYNLIRSLALRGHRVTLLTLWSSHEEQQSLNTIQAYCEEVHAFHLPSWRPLWNCLSALPSPTPLQAAYCWHPVLVMKLGELLNQRNGRPAYDVVHVEHLRGARFGLEIQRRYNQDKSGHLKGAPFVWDSVDCITNLFRKTSNQAKNSISRWMARFELNRTENYEGWLASQFDRVLVTSPVEKEAFESLLAGGRDPDHISVLRNGVDLEYFSPDPAIERDHCSLVVTGKMSYHANVAMCLHLIEDIMPIVWDRRPEVSVYLVGKDPPRAIRNLGGIPSVTVTGTVADVRPYLRRATIAVAPLKYGAGIQNKVLEAMACGTPVITTPQTVSSLPLRAEHDVLVAPDPQQFAASILELLESAGAQKQLGKAGRAYVETHHNWIEIAGRLEQIYAQSIQI